MPKIPGLGDTEFTDEQLAEARRHFTQYQPEQIKGHLKESLGELLPNLDFNKNLNEVLGQVSEGLSGLKTQSGANAERLAAFEKFIKSNGLDPAQANPAAGENFNPKEFEAKLRADLQKEKADFQRDAYKSGALKDVISIALGAKLKPEYQAAFEAQLKADFDLAHKADNEAVILFNKKADGTPFMVNNQFASATDIAKHMAETYKAFFDNAPGGFGKPSGDNRQQLSDGREPTNLSTYEKMRAGMSQFIENSPDPAPAALP